MFRECWIFTTTSFKPPTFFFFLLLFNLSRITQANANNYSIIHNLSSSNDTRFLVTTDIGPTAKKKYLQVLMPQFHIRQPVYLQPLLIHTLKCIFFAYLIQITGGSKREKGESQSHTLNHYWSFFFVFFMNKIFIHDYSCIDEE